MDTFSYLLGKSKGGGGPSPSGTINITSNGTHNVKDYATANVNVEMPTLTPKSITFGSDMETIDLSYIDSINMTSLENMFAYVYMLSSITWGDFGINTTNVLSIENMFLSDGMIESIDLSSFDFSNLTNTSSAFAGCYALTFLDLRTIDFSNVVDSSNMLSDVPTNCTIVVADSTQVDYFNNNFSDYTNVITVEEYESA